MKKFWILAACAATFYACSSSDINTPEIQETGTLQVSTSVLTQNTKGTKAPVTDSKLPAGAKIGIFVFNNNTINPYDGGGKSDAAFNQEWTANGADASQTWTGTPFILSIKHADILAYYPYTDGANFNQINIQAGYTDYLVGSHNGTVNGTEPAAKIQLDHALTMVSFTFKRDVSYPASNECNLQKIHIPGLNQSASINLKTKEVSSYSGDGDFIIQKCINNAYSTITSDKITDTAIDSNNTYHALLLPQTGTDEKSVVVKIDNIDYTVKLPINSGDDANKWVSGRQYTYNLTISGTSGQGNQLQVTSVSVTPWTAGGSSDIEI